MTNPHTSVFTLESVFGPALPDGSYQLDEFTIISREDAEIALALYIAGMKEGEGHNPAA